MVYIQLNSEQEKASLSFELSLKKFPHVRKFKTLTGVSKTKTSKTKT